MEIVMSGIAKAFGTNQVLRDVSITLKEGEVHALMGENGAGKSTLMNILTGIHKGGLAGAVFSHQGVNLALLEGNTYIAQYLVRTKCLCNA